MRILIATPMFPPDTAPAALYVKDLATRLATDHDVTVLMYGKLPESVPGAEYVCVRKNQSLPQRILSYTKMLFKTGKKADVIILQNGPSVELPFILSRLALRTPTILNISDRAAREKINSGLVFAGISKLTDKLSDYQVIDTTPLRPEVYPFDQYPTEQMQNYEQAWEDHLNHLASIFRYVHK